MHLRTLLIVSVISLACGQDRKITSTLNPDCESCSENTTLVYIKAVGPHDTIHQLWDFTRGAPTIIYAVSGANSSLTVSWDKDKPDMFSLSEDLKYSFAMAITELYEYDDLEDLGHLSPRSPGRSFPLHGSRWSRRDSVLTDQEAMLVMHSSSYQRDGRWRNGTVDLKLDYLPFKGFSWELPHLIHTGNSSLLDVRLVNLTASRDYNASRFALRARIVSTDDRRASMAQEMVKSLDDEHTPGVFEIIEIKTPSCARGAGGFLQFRPVAYTQPERGVTTSTIVHVSDFNRTSLEKRSTLYAFYREHSNVDLLIQDMYVSFGEPGDGYYRQHNYTAWSSTFGYGSPPVETFSLFVILVITIGLSVPVLLALSGIIYVAVRRCRARNPHRPLDDQ